MTLLECVGAIIVLAVVGLLVGFIGYSAVGSSANLELVREQAEATAQEDRLHIVAEEGYRRGFLGARVYYHFERVPSNGILYSGFYQKRPYTNEIHLYNFRALDAIKPTN